MQNAEFRIRKLLPRALSRCRRTAVSAFCILHSVLLIAFLTACAKPKVATAPVGPPLNVPAAPPHQIAVEQVAEVPVLEPPPAPEPTPPAPRPAATRTPARTPPPSEVAAPAAAPATTPQPTAPEAPAIRAAPAAASAADERKVRDLMNKAATDLARVDYQRLSKEGKANYDQSKRFSEEAQQAIKERNFVYATTLAEKAATLAAELAGR